MGAWMRDQFKKGQERTRKDKKGQERTRKDKKGQERTRKDKEGEERGGGEAEGDKKEELGLLLSSSRGLLKSAALNQPVGPSFSPATSSWECGVGGG
jgi:hypothetical protein